MIKTKYQHQDKIPYESYQTCSCNTHYALSIKIFQNAVSPKEIPVTDNDSLKPHLEEHVL